MQWRRLKKITDLRYFWKDQITSYSYFLDIIKSHTIFDICLWNKENFNKNEQLSILTLNRSTQTFISLQLVRSDLIVRHIFFFPSPSLVSSRCLAHHQVYLMCFAHVPFISCQILQYVSYSFRFRSLLFEQIETYFYKGGTMIQWLLELFNRYKNNNILAILFWEEF